MRCGGPHASPEGHFRRGHFRVLKSERFVNKRWQSVFVRQTFVGGEAKTVLSPEQAQEAGEESERGRPA